ncbi:hypothetical protein [Shinella sp.]|uniref:hypothetical protein n=1 Tax=Shinella sp. TaxID=1870904 RepID=UPI0039E39874
MSSPYRHGNHFTPFLPTARMPATAADQLRRIELALLAIIAVSLGAAIAGMI